MKILCVGNGCFTEKSGRLLTHQLTGSFLSELRQYFEGVRFLQVFSKRISHTTLNDCELETNGVEPVAVVVNSASRLTKLVPYLKAVPLLARETAKAHFLYLFMPSNLSTLVSMCARAMGKRYGVYLRGEFGIDSRHSRLVLSHASFVVAEGGVLADKARRFCDDVALTVPMFDLSEQDCRADRVFSHDPPWNILYVGRIEARKGINELVEAARLLQKRNVQFRLDLAGNGQDLERIMAESRGELQGYVHCLGLVSERQELFSLYRHADLFVFPSHNEGFPRVLYEAMCFHTPIITTFVGSIGSLMEHNVNCVRVEVGDAAALASSIEMVLRDVDLRRRIGENGNKTMRCLLEENRGNSHARQVREKVNKHARTR